MEEREKGIEEKVVHRESSAPAAVVPAPVLQSQQSGMSAGSTGSRKGSGPPKGRGRGLGLAKQASPPSEIATSSDDSGALAAPSAKPKAWNSRLRGPLQPPMPGRSASGFAMGRSASGFNRSVSNFNTDRRGSGLGRQPSAADSSGSVLNGYLKSPRDSGGLGPPSPRGRKDGPEAGRGRSSSSSPPPPGGPKSKDQEPPQPRQTMKPPVPHVRSSSYGTQPIDHSFSVFTEGLWPCVHGEVRMDCFADWTRIHNHLVDMRRNIAPVVPISGCRKSFRRCPDDHNAITREKGLWVRKTWAVAHGFPTEALSGELKSLTGWNQDYYMQHNKELTDSLLPWSPYYEQDFQEFYHHELPTVSQLTKCRDVVVKYVGIDILREKQEEERRMKLRTQPRPKRLFEPKRIGSGNRYRPGTSLSEYSKLKQKMEARLESANNQIRRAPKAVVPRRRSAVENNIERDLDRRRASEMRSVEDHSKRTGDKSGESEEVKTPVDPSPRLMMRRISAASMTRDGSKTGNSSGATKKPQATTLPSPPRSPAASPRERSPRERSPRGGGARTASGSREPKSSRDQGRTDRDKADPERKGRERTSNVDASRRSRDPGRVSPRSPRPTTTAARSSAVEETRSPRGSPGPRPRRNEIPEPPARPSRPSGSRRESPSKPSTNEKGTQVPTGSVGSSQKNESEHSTPRGEPSQRTRSSKEKHKIIVTGPSVTGDKLAKGDEESEGMADKIRKAVPKRVEYPKVIGPNGAIGGDDTDASKKAKIPVQRTESLPDGKVSAKKVERSPTTEFEKKTESKETSGVAETSSWSAGSHQVVGIPIGLNPSSSHIAESVPWVTPTGSPGPALSQMAETAPWVTPPGSPGPPVADSRTWLSSQPIPPSQMQYTPQQAYQKSQVTETPSWTPQIVQRPLHSPVAETAPWLTPPGTPAPHYTPIIEGTPWASPPQQARSPMVESAPWSSPAASQPGTHLTELFRPTRHTDEYRQIPIGPLTGGLAIGGVPIPSPAAYAYEPTPAGQIIITAYRHASQSAPHPQGSQVVGQTTVRVHQHEAPPLPHPTPAQQPTAAPPPQSSPTYQQQAPQILTLLVQPPQTVLQAQQQQQPSNSRRTTLDPFAVPYNPAEYQHQHASPTRQVYPPPERTTHKRHATADHKVHWQQQQQPQAPPPHYTPQHDAPRQHHPPPQMYDHPPPQMYEHPPPPEIYGNEDPYRYGQPTGYLQHGQAPEQTTEPQYQPEYTQPPPQTQPMPQYYPDSRRRLSGGTKPDQGQYEVPPEYAQFDDNLMANYPMCKAGAPHGTFRDPVTRHTIGPSSTHRQGTPDPYTFRQQEQNQTGGYARYHAARY